MLKRPHLATVGPSCRRQSTPIALSLARAHNIHENTNRVNWLNGLHPRLCLRSRAYTPINALQFWPRGRTVSHEREKFSFLSYALGSEKKKLLRLRSVRTFAFHLQSAKFIILKRPENIASPGWKVNYKIGFGVLDDADYRAGE